MIVHFRPAMSGGWLALTSGETLLVIGAPADQAMVDALWIRSPPLADSRRYWTCSQTRVLLQPRRSHFSMVQGPACASSFADQ